MERTASAASDGVLRLAMWSGPRNISTAFMRSWENRGDTIVIDEPFYAHYLKVTGLDHPGRDEIIAHQESDWRRVAGALLAPMPPDIRVFYQKQMSHHLLPHMGREWLDSVTHAFLIRDPSAMLASLGEKLTNFDLLATGLPQQVEIFEHVILRTGKVPAVLDSADLLERPEPMLRALCDALGVPFTERMLSWPAGRRESDGVWARHWYDRVERSTGFETPPTQPEAAAAARSLPPAVAAIEAQCRPLYERLRAHRLRA
jgi:hypothetical protein